MVRLESERPGTALAKTVAIFPDEPFLKSSICFSSSLVTCLADVESSSAREALIVIVGSASGFFSASVVSEGEAAKAEFERKMAPPSDRSGMIFFASDFLVKSLLLFILFPIFSP
ncbi:Uncharacterised protein [Acinetobacter baumannii]|nr:Uncharacterised protein [Acinetobacter baumannii]SSQ12200.1 Uncharacterised protein [Acinetobacter baumannii]SSQ41172.1 Uncharacterised protein [Acinetobacter baumannii]SSS47705.1 Uncharacterised protein [Acinetobacter baumannii]SVK00661.1 Uncharacterised protein [Acinetobacter baumannii]